MRRSVVSALLSVVLLSAGAQAALAIGTLDQSTESSFTGSCLPQYRGQTFTAGITGGLDTIELHGPGSGNFGTTWNIEIRAVTGGLPAGASLATASAPLVSGWSRFTLSQPVPVTAGQIYAIVSTTSPCWASASAEYVGGTALRSDDAGASWTAVGADLAFRTYVSAAPPPEPVRIGLTITHGVAANQAGPFASSLTAATGSAVWHQVSVTNSGGTGLVGLTIGPLAASCPALPTPFAVGATYTCTYSAAMPTGSTTSTVTATFGVETWTASVTLTGTGSSGIGSKLGSPSAPGDYTAATKIASLGQYVTWRASLGAAAANAVVGVEVAAKASDGTWGAFTRLTSRRADAGGVVTFSWRSTRATWVSVRFRADSGATTASQARWR